jgi:hypothetical protein
MMSNRNNNPSTSQEDLTMKGYANLCAAGVLALGLGASAQVAGQQPTTQPQTQAGAAASTDQPTMITGCVQREADYRRARDAGRGGVAGTGVGAGNEFILAEASAASSSATGSRPSQPGSPTGTAGSAGTMAYELTGPNEGQVGQYVNRRVEITGRFKAAETDPAGRTTGGATAGAPPSGVDVVSKDLKLREFEVLSVRETSGTCTPAPAVR